MSKTEAIIFMAITVLLGIISTRTLFLIWILLKRIDML